MGLLEGKVSIITGAGRGVGRAVAAQMAREGAAVVINDLDEEPARETAEALKELGAESAVCVGSVTDVTLPDKLIRTTLDAFGRVDIIVNNAGYTWDCVVHKMSDEQFDAMLDVHVKAPFRLIRAAAPYIRETAKREMAEGRRVQRKIINISSVSGVMGNVGQANYAAAKAGVIGLTKTVAREWGQFNINCNAVAYGFIDTRLTKEKEGTETVTVGDKTMSIGIPKAARDAFVQMIPLGRAGTPEDAAGPVIFLASPLSDYVSGVVILVTGGMYM